MTAKYLWVLGSAIIFVLGTLHLFYTFFTNKFSSKNESLIDEMKKSYPRLTRQTTMWKAWMGFNASHSSGAIFIGAINCYLAVKQFEWLQADAFYMPFNILTIGFYVWLAKKYWFKIPFAGIAACFVCYLLSYLLK
jgi:hypothetical protein